MKIGKYIIIRLPKGSNKKYGLFEVNENGVCLSDADIYGDDLLSMAYEVNAMKEAFRKPIMELKMN